MNVCSETFQVEYQKCVKFNPALSLVMRNVSMSNNPVIVPSLVSRLLPSPLQFLDSLFNGHSVLSIQHVSIGIMLAQQTSDYDSGFIKIECDTNAAVLSLAWSAEKTNPLKAAVWEVSFRN